MSVSALANGDGFKPVSKSVVAVVYDNLDSTNYMPVRIKKYDTKKYGSFRIS